MFDNKNTSHYITTNISGWKKYIGLTFLVVFFSFIIPLLGSTATHAAPLPLPEQNDAKIQKVMLNRFLGYCLKNAPLSGGVLWDNGARITGNDTANKGDWFMASTAAIGPYMTDDRFGLWSGADDSVYNRSAGLGDCGDEKTIKKAISLFGGSGVELLCKSGFVRSDGSDGGTVQGCIAGNGDFKHKNGANNGSDDAYKAFLKAYPEPSMNDRDWYWFYRKTFNWSCGYGKMGTEVNKATADANKEFGFSLDYVTNTAPYIETKYFIGAEKRGTTIGTRLGDTGTANPVNKTCAEIEGHIKSFGASYAAYLKSLEGSPDLEGEINPESGDDGESIVEGSSSCTVAGVGWIVCPAIDFMSQIADGAFAVIQNFLRVNVATYSIESGTFVAWATFRDIANVLFVIAFLVILFSQLTGQGVSNYGVKKTLPRLIVTVILVNVSFYVCQIAVDVTQIVGGGVVDLLKNIPVGTAETATPGQWTDVMGDILMGSGIVAGIVIAGAAAFSIAALSISSAVLLAFLLAVLMTVVILIGRQAAIVILIVLAPVAFVAYLLPNTERWFKRWVKIFWGLLLVYPIVAILYGGGDLAARIIANVGNTSNNLDAQTKFWFGIIAIGVSAIPLIMTPTLLKGALKATGDMGGKLSGIASKANSRVKSSANATSRYGEAKAGIKNRFALNRAKRRGSSSVQQAIDNSRFGRAIGLDKGGARATNAVLREDEEGVEASVGQIKTSPGFDSVNAIPVAQKALRDAIVEGNSTKARAAQRILLSSGNKGISAVQEVYEGSVGGSKDSTLSSAFMSTKSADTMGELRTELNKSGLKGKNNALASFGYSGTHDSLSGHVKSASTYTGLNPVELAGQSIENLAANQQAFDASMARAVLNNPDSAALLDANKRALFEARLEGGVVQKVTSGENKGSYVRIPGTGTSTASAAAATVSQATVTEAPASTATVSADGGISIPHGDQPQTPPVDPYDTRNVQRRPDVDPSREVSQAQDVQDQQSLRDRTATPEERPSDPASDSQARPPVNDQRNDTGDRTS